MKSFTQLLPRLMGRKLTLKISGWNQLLMRGTKDYQMHKHPFRLLQVVVSDQKGQTIWKPMWLIVIGSRLSLVQQTLGHSTIATTQKYLHAKPDDSSGLYLEF